MDIQKQTHDFLKNTNPLPPKKRFNPLSPKIIIPALVVVLLGGVIFALTKTAPQKESDSQQAGRACPEQIIYNAGGSPEVVENGQKRAVQSQEEISWLDANCKQKDASMSFDTLSAIYSENKCEGQGSKVYTKELIALKDLGQITPLGRMYDSHVTPTDHQYWQPVSTQAKTGAYPVYAPADGTIVKVEKHSAGKATTTDQNVSVDHDEYQLVIEHTCDHYLVLTHMHSVAEPFLKQMSFEGSGQNTSFRGRVVVKAGDLLSSVGGNTFDVMTLDGSKKLTGFAKPEHYKTEPWKVFTSDPIAYFTDSLKTAHYAKVSRGQEPISGKIDYDQSGKLVGNWFREGTDGYMNGTPGRYWDGHLSFAYNQHNPKVAMVSTGHFLGDTSAQFMVDSAAPDPAKVDSKSGVVRYKLYEYSYQLPSGATWLATTPAKDVVVKAGNLKGHVLVQVVADDKIKVEFSGPEAASTNFSDKAQTYTR